MDAYGISVRQPQPQDLIGSTVAIAALGTAFEASYAWRLLDGDTVLAEGFVHAGSMGVMSPFTHQADLAGVTHVGPAVFEFAGDDPSGESAGLDVTRVPVVVVPGAAGYVPHQVVAGDTLSQLVRDNTWSDLATVETIAAANGLSDPDKIRVGQILRIPV